MQVSCFWRNLGLLAHRRTATARILAAAAILVYLTILSADAMAGTLKLYWSDGDIHRANLDGTQAEDIVQSPSGEHPNIAFDPVDQKMYWPSAAAGGIERANYDGTDIETAITGIAGPRKVAIDAVNRKAYWLDYGWPNTIWRSNLDGMNRELLFSTSSWPPLDVAVDPINGYYYWTGFRGDIHRTSLDGLDTKTINFAEFPGALGIDPASGYLYVSDYLQQAIIRMRLDLSEPTLWVTQDVSYPSGIVVYPINERVIWSNSQLSPLSRNISSIRFDGADQRIDFYPQWGGGYPLVLGTYLGIVAVSNPEPSSLILAGIGGMLIPLLSSRRRPRR